MEELKEGDWIRIREWDDMEKEYGLNGDNIKVPFSFVRDMRKYCGKVLRIHYMGSCGDDTLYVLRTQEEKPTGFNFSIEMFEKGTVKIREFNIKKERATGINEWLLIRGRETRKEPA